MSNEILAKYTFVPWLRRGVASKIQDADAFGGVMLNTDSRAKYNVKAVITNDSGGTEDIPKSLQIVGPGDVVGIERRSIIKTEPANWITNFEPNFFPFIEFYEEDFPWRFTPAAPVGSKLRPWITLIVLKESEFDRNDVLEGPLPSITIPGGPMSAVFPNPAQTWAWAHIQLNGNLDTTTGQTMDPTNSADVTAAMNRLVGIVEDDPDSAYSRILCPRKLEANTSYHAFLIPSFETGRRAGLGVDDVDITAVPAQTPSFGVAQTIESNKYPVYHEWFFKTGNAGGFEYLVRQIIPRPVDDRVGKRLMDVQNPGYNVQFSNPTSPPNEGAVYLEGALRAPATNSQGYPWVSTSDDYFTTLRDLLNLGEDLNQATLGANFYAAHNLGGSTENIEDDPIVVPPIYGRWHALRRRVEDTTISASQNSWLNELNMDPRNRAVAGLGADYVEKNQDLLMDKAWDQLGEILEANRKLRWAQMAQATSVKAFAKHLEHQSAEQGVPMMAKMQRRVKSSATASQWKDTTESAQPLATLDHAYRRLQRPNGPVLRKVDETNQISTQNDLVTKLANKSLNTVAPKDVSSLQRFGDASDLWTNINTVRATNSVVFKFSNPGDTSYTTGNSTEQANFLAAVEPFKNYFLGSNWLNFDAGSTLDVDAVQATSNTELNPKFTIPKWIYATMQFPGPPPPPDKIVPVMAYPVLDRAMYESVRDQGVDYLVPNLQLIPNDTITLLETNQKFIESFMVGANHEMGRELLWREFPTDQRGSYFRRFWDASDYVDTQGRTPEQIAESTYDIPEVHSWLSNTNLGSHDSRAANGEASNMVLVIRGELLKKFPNTVIYAQKAKYQEAIASAGGSSGEEARTSGEGESGGEESSGGSNERTSGGSNLPIAQLLDLDAPRLLDTEILFPIFSAKIEPDITFLGFDLTTDEAIGDRSDPNKPGWFFIIKERPGETRFGIDETPTNGHTATPGSWSDLDWKHIEDANVMTMQPEFGPSFTHSNDYVNVGNLISPSSNEINGKPIEWGKNSADMALILYQQPVMIAIHAFEMIP